MEQQRMLILKDSGDGILHFYLLSFWTFSIVWKEHNISEAGSASLRWKRVEAPTQFGQLERGSPSIDNSSF